MRTRRQNYGSPPPEEKTKNVKAGKEVKSARPDEGGASSAAEPSRSKGARKKEDHELAIELHPDTNPEALTIENLALRPSTAQKGERGRAEKRVERELEPEMKSTKEKGRAREIREPLLKRELPTRTKPVQARSESEPKPEPEVTSEVASESKPKRELAVEKRSKSKADEDEELVNDEEYDPQSSQSGTEDEVEDEDEDEYNSEANGPDIGEAKVERVQPPVHAPHIPVHAPVKLIQEQEELVQLALDGHNIFYTGAAGAGKSAVLNAIVKGLQDQGKIVHVTASTGIAALNVNGTTIWTYLGIGLSVNNKPIVASENIARSQTSQASGRIQATDVLIIDEISMVESNLFFRVDAMMKAARGSSEPFGGVQVIITGDFCQLPPVRPFENCVHCGSNVQKTGFGQKVQWECKHERKDHPQKWSKGDEWAFNSTAWKEASFVNVYLKIIHRQSDKRFLELLNRCRFGKRLSDADIGLVARPGDPESPSYTSAVRLMCVNKDVDKVNTSEFDKLDTPDVQTYLCLDNHEWVRGKGQGKLDKFAEMVSNNETGRETLKEFKDHRFPAKLKLRIGTVVALVTNMDLAAGLCNGSQGVVIGFELFESTAIRVHTENMDIGKANLINNWVNQYRPRSFPIVKFNAAHGRPEVRRTIYPECFISSKKEKGSNVLLSRAQIPLIQSWAMTIHRSQGMTLDFVRADLSKIFEKGQAYVALSRATTLGGLWLEGSTKEIVRKTGADPEVMNFFERTDWYDGGPPELA